MFKFKHFLVRQDLCAMKVGTDGVLLGAWANGGDSILDVGTGTGLIALMMAQRYPDAQITAIDIDEGATRQALQNVENAGCQHRIKVLQEKVQAHEGLYDAIVSNPPFFIDSLGAPDAQTFVGFFPSRVCAIKTVVRKPVRRFLLSFRKHPCERVLETMTMGDDYYQQLTKDFYL